MLPPGTCSSLKFLSFLQVLPLIAVGVLFGVAILLRGLISELVEFGGGDGVLGEGDEEDTLLVTGEEV